MRYVGFLSSPSRHGINLDTLILCILQKTFEDYTEKTAFERPLTSGVAYALRVLHSRREKVEKQQGWIIRKMDTEDQTLDQDLVPEKLEPSPIQAEYAPVIFAQKTVSHIVSIDMMSGKVSFFCFH